MTAPAQRARLAIVAGALLLAACDTDRVTAPDADPSLRRFPKKTQPAPTEPAPSEPEPTPTEPAPAPTEPAPAPTAGHPTLPLATVNTAVPAITGRTITVAAGGDLQGAINAAVPGDVVVLAAGATYTGNFYLPNKSGTGWVTIRTSTPDGSLPAAGTRIAPSQAGLLPKLVSPNGSAALRTTAGAHHYRIIGLEITAAPSVTFGYQLLMLGSGSASAQGTLAAVPSHIVVDRSYIHGHANLNLKNCVELHAAHTAIVDSYLDQCHSASQESHAIIGWNGPGPFRIENNRIAGAHINIMFGGADPASVDLMPSDITIRRNHVVKPLAWKGVWGAKNLLELKIGRRVLVEGNVLENNWVDEQRGFAVVVKTAVGAGAASWGRTEDVTLRRNVVRNVAGGIAISAQDDANGLPTRRIRLEHNVWDGVGASNGTVYGRMFQVLPGVDVVQIEHNTAIHSTTYADALVRFGNAAVGNFVFRDNIASRGTGVFGDGTAEGTASLDRYAPGHVFTHNVIAGAPAASYPAGGYFPASLSDVGFVSLAGRDYRLSTSSPFKGKASDGTDPGADVASVTSLTTGVVR